jgi:hypothetical protein
MKYRNVLTGELLASGEGSQGINISALLANFPVALAIAKSFAA